jgi:alpha-glucosidase
LNDPTGVPWWRDAVVYQVYVRSFADSNGDGLGDLPGITRRLPYLKELGVDALWITPFYPSPQHDAGYDVSDYRDVDPRFGTLADADALIAKAHRLGLRVVVDLVPNHTSDEHEWFQKALVAAPGSPEREHYIFRDGKGRGRRRPPNNWQSIFGGIAWEQVDDGPDRPGQWYLHLFDRTQPDLNWRKPEVRAMFVDVLRFWLDRGVDGFRVDVAHGLVKDARLRDDPSIEPGVEPGVEPGSRIQPGSLLEHDTKDEPMWDQPEVHEIYRDWHRVLAEYDGDRMAVAEAWVQTPARTAAYVRPDELQQAFNFAWLLAKWDARDLADCIRRTFETLEPVGGSPTWVLSNHDVVRHATRYGGGPVGVARARAATLAMLALPGSSYLYQGEELGLESVDVPEELRQDPAWLRTGVEWRDHCRVPMPWSGARPPFGFGGRRQPWLPMPESWAGLTVEAQTGKRGSTLELYRKALKVRRTFAATGPREVEMLDRGKTVLAFRRGPVTVVLNAGNRPVSLPEGKVLVNSGRLSDGKLPPNTAVWIRQPPA